MIDKKNIQQPLAILQHTENTNSNFNVMNSFTYFLCTIFMCEQKCKFNLKFLFGYLFVVAVACCYICTNVRKDENE